MKKQRAGKVVDAGKCREGMEELILAYAEGSVKTGDEREKVMMHLASCAPCRYLLEDFMSVHDGPDMVIAEEEMTRVIEFKVSGSGLVPVTGARAQAQAFAQVLSEMPGGSLEYRMPINHVDSSLLMVPGRHGVTMEVRPGSGEAAYHLVGAGEHLVATSRGSAAIFDSLSPGTYFLSDRFRDVVVIRIKE